MTKKRGGIKAKQRRAGWIFLLPASIMIAIMSFWPMIQALITSFKKGPILSMTMAEPWYNNYTRIFQDKIFMTAMKNTFFYLIIQVPIMLVLAILLAQILNNKDIKFRGLFRTMVFLPCATSLVSYALIFKSLFATQGLINQVLTSLHIISSNINWLGTAGTAKFVIILALIWRWTGYNMVFYLSSMQSIDYSIYEAARIDGASPFTQLTKITMPLLKPIILVTAIMSTNGTLQLYDESVALTNGGPANASITMSHYIYNTTFVTSPNFGYAAAMSFLILIMVAILSAIQMKVGDKR